MREQLIQYVELLFAGSTGVDEIKEEILQNTLDRYDDLIAQGKTPQAAYSLAISGIGDVTEILGKQENTAETAPAVPEKAAEAPSGWKKILRAIGICLYIMCPIPLFVLGNTIGLCGLLTFVAVATALMVISGGKGSGKEKEAKQDKKHKSELHKAIDSILWAVMLCAYFAVSFTTQAWHITWLIFPIAGAADGMVSAFFDLKRSTVSAIVRIVIYFLVISILLGLLIAGFGGNFGFSGMDFSVKDYTLGNGQVSASSVRDLNVEWVDGDITIVPADTDSISFENTGKYSEKYEMAWELSGSSLTICYSKPSVSVGFGNVPSKDLQITVPKDWVCNTLDIETVSGSVTVQSLNAGEVSLECVSAEGTFTDCTIDAVTLTTVSGDLEYTGTINSMECEAVSAKCYINALNTPNEITAEGVSGDLIITLPEDTGFQASVESLSGSIYSDFATNSSSDRQTYGDGRCRIEVESVSGNIKIYKAK